MKKVKVYNFVTKKLSSIPVSELAPGMIEAEVQGIGRVWVAASQLKMDGSYQHPPFSEEVRDFLRRIKAALDEVFPQTLEGWEDGFRKDINAEREIALWLNIAATYEQCTATVECTAQQRQEYFDVIAACSTSPREHIFEIFKPVAITRGDAERAVELFYSPKNLT